MHQFQIKNIKEFILKKALCYDLEIIASRCGLVLRQFPKLTVNRLEPPRAEQHAAGNRQEQNLYSPAQSVCSIHRWVALVALIVHVINPKTTFADLFSIV